MILGVGWQDCQSLPPCTLHSQQLTSEWKEKPSRTLHSGRHFPLSTSCKTLRHSKFVSWPLLLTFTQGIVAVTHAHPISRPLSYCCSPTCPGRAVHSSRGLIVPLTHRSFWVFPRRSFPAKLRMLWLSKVDIFSLPLRGLCVFSQ